MSLSLTVIIVVLLIGYAAICSGLNIALMAIDPSTLKRKAKLGNPAAIRVLPLRNKTHLTLASILMTNVAAVSATSLVLGQHLNGFVAGAISTLSIVIFAEIIPQVIFAKNPLTWVSRFAWLLKLMIVLTYPISKPLQVFLDRLVGHAPNRLQSRHELGLMIKEYLGPSIHELDEDEVEIIRGALQLSEKNVSSILTPIEKTFWMTKDTMIDSEKATEIKLHGFSRVPIFNQELTRCDGVLLMKDLVNIDFDHESVSVSRLPLHPVEPVGSRTALDTMFRKFTNTHTHLIPIEKNQSIIGIATIEDLIEEILGHEIKDETDFKKKRD